MDTFWLILGILFVLAGIVGSILPMLPGPPLSYVGLLIQQFKSEPPYTVSFLVIWGVITIVVFVIDYVVPAYGTRKFGGTRYGMWGSTIGLLLGLFFVPWGIILGPFVGAFLGEMIASNKSNQAFRAAVGSFIGFIVGTLLKLIACVVMGWYLLAPVW